MNRTAVPMHDCPQTAARTRCSTIPAGAVRSHTASRISATVPANADLHTPFHEPAPRYRRTPKFQTSTPMVKKTAPTAGVKSAMPRIASLSRKYPAG